MTTDERIDRLVERHEALTQSVESLTRDIHDMQEQVAKHEKWQQKVERTLVAGMDAALRELRNGEGA